MALQQKDPLKYWKTVPFSGSAEDHVEPAAVILLIADSMEEIESIRQRMLIASSTQSALDEIEYESTLTLLSRSSLKFRRTQPTFTDFHAFEQWCKEVEVFFPAPLKSKGKKSQQITQSLGEQLLEASSCLYQEELYPVLYEELKRLAPSNVYASKKCLINSNNSHFYIETSLKIKKIIQGILSRYREWMKANNLFDITLSDLSERQFMRIRSRHGVKYTHIVWAGEEMFLLNLKPYFEKIADMLVTKHTAKEICDELYVALAEPLNGQPFFLKNMFREQLLTPSFIRATFELDDGSYDLLLYRVFFMDIPLMVEVLKALRHSPETLLIFINFIFDFNAGAVAADSLFEKAIGVKNDLIHVLLEIFATPAWAKKILIEESSSSFLLKIVKVLDLESFEQTRLFAALLISLNAQLDFVVFQDIEEFVSQYEKMLICLEQKHGELDGSDAHKEISQLIFSFACLFAKKALSESRHLICLYEKVLQIFAAKEINSKDELDEIMKIFQAIHKNALMKTQLLTDTDIQKNGAWNQKVWDRVQKIWDMLRHLYVIMIKICSAITGFTGFSEVAIQTYVFFKEQLTAFPIACRPEKHLPYADLYVSVLAIFKAEFEVAEKQNKVIAEEFFKQVVDFLVNFPAHAAWPDMWLQQIYCSQSYLFVRWMRLLHADKIPAASARVVWQKWQVFLPNIAEVLSTQASSLFQAVEETFLIQKDASDVSLVATPIYTTNSNLLMFATESSFSESKKLSSPTG